MKKNIFLHIRYLKTILILFLLCSQTNSYCQNSNINAYAVFDDSVRAIGQLSGNIYLTNLDTTLISQFEIKVAGSETDTVYLVSQIIDFDMVTPPTGFTYERTGDKLRIGVSGAQPSWTYYNEVRIKDLQGQWSQPFRFLAN